MLESLFLSLNWTTIFLSVVSLLAYGWYRNVCRPAGFPPGPVALPIVGNIFGKMSFSKFYSHSAHVAINLLTNELIFYCSNNPHSPKPRLGRKEEVDANSSEIFVDTVEYPSIFTTYAAISFLFLFIWLHFDINQGDTAPLT